MFIDTPADNNTNHSNSNIYLLCQFTVLDTLCELIYLFFLNPLSRIFFSNEFLEWKGVSGRKMKKHQSEKDTLLGCLLHVP